VRAPLGPLKLSAQIRRATRVHVGIYEDHNLSQMHCI